MVSKKKKKAAKKSKAKKSSNKVAKKSKAKKSSKKAAKKSSKKGAKKSSKKPATTQTTTSTWTEGSRPASTRPVWQKLFIKGGTLLLANAPAEAQSWLQGAPATVTTDATGDVDTVFGFAADFAELDAK